LEGVVVQDIDENTYKAILYTDGSALMLPSKGPYGSGCHGYLYTENDIKNNGDKPVKYTVTDRGYLEKHELTPEDKQVKPSLYFNAVYSYDVDGTNNRAELLAIADSVGIITSNKSVSDIILYTDSKYSMGVFKLVSSDLDTRKWNTLDKPNMDLWEVLADVLSSCKEVNIDVRKILAHSTAIGNNLADRLAFCGRNLARMGSKDKIFKFYKGKYWKDRTILHPLLNFKQTYFNTGLMPESDEHIYTVMDHPTKVDFGKNSPEPIYGLSMFAKPVEEISMVANKFLEYTNGHMYISALDLRVLSTQHNKKMSELLGDKAYDYGKDGKLRLLEEDVIVTPIIPAGMGHKALKKTIKLYKLYCKFKEGVRDDGVTTFTEITDSLYDVNDKGKYKYKIPITNSIGPKVTVNINGSDSEITLMYGNDVLSRNQHGRLALYEPKVWICLVKLSNKIYEYYTIYETKEACGIYCNFYINKIYL